MALNLADKAYVLEVNRIAVEGRATDLLNNDYVKRAYLGG
jgi:branched-chain amino acid transport system ATP-binding protein